MTFSAETWAVKKEELDRLERTQMRMLRWMAGVSRSERRRSEGVRREFRLDSIADVICRSRLRWFGHVMRREPTHATRVAYAVEVEGRMPRGRPRLTWRAKVQEDLDRLKLCEDDAKDRVKWRRVIAELSRPTSVIREKRP